MVKFRTSAAVAIAMALAFTTSANAEVVAAKAVAKGIALVPGSEKTIDFFSGGSKVSKKRRADVAALAGTPGGAAAPVENKTNFVQLGIVAIGAAAAGAGGGVAAAGSGGTAASN